MEEKYNIPRKEHRDIIINKWKDVKIKNCYTPDQYTIQSRMVNRIHFGPFVMGDGENKVEQIRHVNLVGDVICYYEIYKAKEIGDGAIKT